MPEIAEWEHSDHVWMLLVETTPNVWEVHTVCGNEKRLEKEYAELLARGVPPKSIIKDCMAVKE